MHCCCMLVFGLVVLALFWEGKVLGAPQGMITVGVAGLLGQELVGLVRRHRRSPG